MLLAAILLLDLAYLTRTYYWDGVLFSLNIEGVHHSALPFTVLFHPNHLLYSALGYVIYSAVSACGLSMRAITVLQILNVVLSVCASYLILFLTKRLTVSFPIAFFCAVLFAFGAIWWKFSTDANSYILCVMLLLLVYLFLVQNPQRLVGAAACHTMAMLFHELSVFMYVPVLAAIALDSRQSRTRRFWDSATYLAGTASAVAIAYLLCYSQVDHRVYPSLMAWITSYASDSGFTHSLGQIAGAYLSSYLKLFVGGKLSFIRDFFSAAVVVSLLICLGALIWAAVQFTWISNMGIAQWDRRGALFLWVWLLTYAIFLGAWDPGSTFHKLFVWPAIVLLLGAYMGRSPVLHRCRFAFMKIAVAIAAWNFAAYIYPHSHDSADPVLTLAEKIDRELPKNAIVYYRAFDPDDWYLDYFAPARQWLSLPSDLSTLDTNRPVCFETTALEELRGNFAFSKKWDLVNGRHNIRLECLKTPER